MGDAPRSPAAHGGTLLLAMPLLALATMAGCGSGGEAPGAPEPAAFERVPGTGSALHVAVWVEGNEVMVELEQRAHVLVLRFQAGGQVERMHPLSDRQLILDAGVNRLRPTPLRSTHRWTPPLARSSSRTDRGRLVVLASVDPVPLPTRTDMREALGSDFRTEPWPVKSVERLLEHLRFDPYAAGNAIAFHP